jgi:hypothetical protein
MVGDDWLGVAVDGVSHLLCADGRQHRVCDVAKWCPLACGEPRPEVDLPDHVASQKDQRQA